MVRGHRRGSAQSVRRDLFLFGPYIGMRRGEIFPLRWEGVDLDAGLFRVEETKTGYRWNCRSRASSGRSSRAAGRTAR